MPLTDSHTVHSGPPCFVFQTSKGVMLIQAWTQKCSSFQVSWMQHNITDVSLLCFNTPASFFHPGWTKILSSWSSSCHSAHRCSSHSSPPAGLPAHTPLLLSPHNFSRIAARSGWACDCPDWGSHTHTNADGVKLEKIHHSTVYIRHWWIWGIWFDLLSQADYEQ